MSEKDGRHVIDAIWTGARTLYENERKIPGTEQLWADLSHETQGVYFSLAMATINAYEVDLNRPMKTALKNGQHILGWSEKIGMWCAVRCVEGCKWPDGFTMWRPMPAPIEEDL